MKHFALIALLFLTSCSFLKTAKLMKAGEVEQKEFNVQIPFEYRFGVVFVKASIKGNEYNFLLDTGAPNAVSKELAKKLNLPIVTERNVIDSQGEKDKLAFVSIDKLSIGDIDFLHTGAIIIDLNYPEEIACFKIDGIIGANLMRKAIWKIDYERKMMTISHSMDALNIPDYAERLPFKTMITGTPRIDMKLNNIMVKNIAFDTGSNGDISLPQSDFLKLKSQNPTLPTAIGFGSSSTGLYGHEKNDTTFYAMISQVTFGDISLQNTRVQFVNNPMKIMGTNFLKNYNVILNWFTREALLVKKEDYELDELRTFGFSYLKQEDKLIVSLIYKNSDAENKGLQMGDHIIRIGGEDIQPLSEDKYCEMRENNPFLDIDEISIVVLRDNEEIEFVLNKSKLL